MISQEEYIQNKGEICPSCKSNNIELDYYPKWVKKTVTKLECTCLDCHETWEEQHEFKHYTITNHEITFKEQE